MLVALLDRMRTKYDECCTLDLGAWRLVQRCQSLAQRVQGSLRTAGQVQLVQDVAHVRAHRRIRDHQHLGNLPVFETLYVFEHQHRAIVGRQALDEGFIVGVTPEGTRSGHGRLQPGHPGVVLLALRSGATLDSFTLAYETYGTLNPDSSNAILVCHYFSGNARAGKLSPTDMQGGCFSISSLGGIGGTQFTPIVNAPEVAILGVSRSQMKPVWNGEEFEPRLIMPFSLSYDHRVIDEEMATREIRDLRRGSPDCKVRRYSMPRRLKKPLIVLHGGLLLWQET